MTLLKRHGRAGVILVMSNTVSFLWLATAVVVPLIVACAVAWPFWRKVTRDPVSTILDCFVVCGFAVALVARELVSLRAFTRDCVELEMACSYHPEPFTRFFLYGSIALARVFSLFVIGWKIEDRLRQREVAPEWRRRAWELASSQTWSPVMTRRSRAASATSGVIGPS